MEWINVKDKLPDPLKSVLFVTKQKTVHEGFMTSSKVFFLYCEYANAANVTYWMPLPEPPK